MSIVIAPSAAVALAVLASGSLLLLGLLSGIWKYSGMMRSERGRAPYYVDVTHRAALMYSFAALVLAVLAYFSVFSPVINVWAVIANVVYFYAAIASYALHGVLKDTDNQFRSPHQLGKLTLPSMLLHGFMGSLIVAEVGGTLVLLAGAAAYLWPFFG
ncbi:MAG: hypothetical protein RL180_602 [Pseudomonadota bacterium]|jgi:hypothetical protein